MFSFFKVKNIRRVSWVDLLIFSGLVVLIYALIGTVHQWVAPFRPKTEIDLGFGALVKYSVYSLVRVISAYLLSLAFTLGYGYAAARSRFGDSVLIPILDILQSVPVLGFMPGLVLALVKLFPNSNIGLELAAVVMIFSGQAWNMVFSFYFSLKNVPPDIKDVARLFRLNQFETLRSVEIPFAMNGLLWNSMLSMAGGWFFLMVIESFKLGDRDFRLPGIGSYMAVAYEAKDWGAVLAGTITMFVLIFIVDRCVWAPLVVWSEKFKYHLEGYGDNSRSVVLEWLRRSDLLANYFEWRDELIKEWTKKLELKKPKKRLVLNFSRDWKRYWKPTRVVLIGLGALGATFGFYSMYRLVSGTSVGDWLLLGRDTLLTFIRVMLAITFGSLWAIPVGVFIGTSRKWTLRLQPVVQIVASFPAPMLFPLITGLFLQLGVSMQFGAVVLMVFASQWYILFNVISGATMIPPQVIEMAQLFQVKGWNYWKAIVLPAIFPSLVGGWITAAGGAWNACIVSEIVEMGPDTLAATGIGATITLAAQRGDFPVLAGAILMMVTSVVVLNRVFWGPLYRLAETRYRLE